MYVGAITRKMANNNKPNDSQLSNTPEIALNRTDPSGLTAGRSSENIQPQRQINLNFSNLIPPFDGDKETTTFFFSQFDQISEMAGWDEHEKATILKAKCTGAARQFLILDTDLINCNVYTQVKNKFQDHFTKKQSLIELNLQFANMAMREHESVRDFAERIKRAGTQFMGASNVISQEASQMLDKILLTKFIEGILPELQREVVLKGPDNFNEAVETALKCQSASEMFARLRINAVGVNNMHATPEQPTNHQSLAPSNHMFCMYCGKNNHFAKDCFELQKVCSTLNRAANNRERAINDRFQRSNYNPQSRRGMVEEQSAFANRPTNQHQRGSINRSRGSYRGNNRYLN